MYVSDALHVIAENTAKYVNGSYLNTRFVDIIRPRKEETRTADEIIEHMKKKLREAS